MPVEVTAGMPPEDMPLPVMLRADTLVSKLAVELVIIGRVPHADTRAMQAALIIGMAAVTGEAVTGEAATGIRPTDIHWAITAWAMAIHPTGLAITVIPTVDTMVRTTDIILTATDTGHP